MIRSHNIIKLLVAAFTVAITSSFNVNAMKRKRDKVSEISQCAGQQNNQNQGRWAFFPEYQLMSAIPQRCLGNEDIIFPKELVKYIFLLNSEISANVDSIIQTSGNPEKLYESIGGVFSKFGSDLSAEIVGIGLKKAGKSLFDVNGISGGTTLHCMGVLNSGAWNTSETVMAIFDCVEKFNGGRAWELLCMKDKYGRMALHWVAVSDNQGVANGLLTVAILLGKDKAWELLCMKDNYRYTALYLAVFSNNPIIVKMLLDQADELGKGKAWELIVMPVDRIETSSWNAASDEIKTIMEQYRPSDK